MPLPSSLSPHSFPHRPGRAGACEGLRTVLPPADLGSCLGNMSSLSPRSCQPCRFAVASPRLWASPPLPTSCPSRVSAGEPACPFLISRCLGTTAAKAVRLPAQWLQARLCHLAVSLGTKEGLLIPAIPHWFPSSLSAKTKKRGWAREPPGKRDFMGSLELLIPASCELPDNLSSRVSGAEFNIQGT